VERLSKKKATVWLVATVLAPLVVGMALASVYISAWYARTGHRGQLPADVLQDGLLYTAPVALWSVVGLWWVIHRRAASFGELFGLRSDSVGLDVLYGVLLGAFWVVVYGLTGWPAFSDMFVLDGGKLASIPASLSAGFCEEFLFRGFVILIIACAGGGTTARLIVSSLAFAAAHMFWGPVGMLFTLALGLSFAAVSMHRGNVWSAVIAHSVLNLCIEPALIDKALSFVQQ